MRIGSLFSGIGGLELGLEWAGVGHTVWQVEQDAYCQQVLARHWPAAARFADVREVGAHNLPSVDVICGGFPCQDISNAGKRVGIGGERSGLWSEFARIIRELRPRYVVVENVAALLTRGLDTVLGDLAAAGYDAEWDVLSAADVGAPHLRRRVFLIAWCADAGERGQRTDGRASWDAGHAHELDAHVADSGRPERRPRIAAGDNSNGTDAGRQETPSRVGECREAVADAEGQPVGAGLCADESRGLGRGRSGDSGRTLPDANLERGLVSTERGHAAVEVVRGDGGPRGEGRGDWWATQSDVGQLVDGVPAGLVGWDREPEGVPRVSSGTPDRVNRLRALGNAVVPACAEVVGRRLLEIAASHPARSFFPAAAAGSDPLARQGQRGGSGR